MSQSLKFETAALEGLARAIEEQIDTDAPAALIGPDLAGLVARIPSEQQVTPGAVVRLALLNDTLRVAERAIGADGRVTKTESAYIEPLVREAQKYLSRFRRVYADTIDVDRHGIEHFLEQHGRDGQMFGGRCKSTAWIGLMICKRAAGRTGDPDFVDDYRDLIVRMLDDLFDTLGAGDPGQKRQIVDDLIQLAPPTKNGDPREIAYCSARSPEVFHAVAHSAEIYEPDLFDVEEIHEEARDAFARLIDRSAEARFGKILLIKGVAGSGKTHLMRAFRNQVHGENLGFVGYLQMSTRVSNYSRYILSNLIDSWDRPFWGDTIPDAAITCLSDSVARDLSSDERVPLADEALPDADLHQWVNRAADRLLASSKYQGIHVDLIRMMLYLQRRDPARRSRVLKFLRCEPLSPYDRKFVGDVVPFEGEEGPARMIAGLGKLVTRAGDGALVLLVDQLEDIYNLDDSAACFRLAMDALRYISDHVPTAVIVVSCLDDFYAKLRGALARPVLDRLEHDPEPLQLTAGRSLGEIENLIGRRLQYLFDRQGVRIKQEERLFPFRHEQLQARANQRTRDVLDWCRAHHEASIRAGRITDPVPLTTPPPAPATAALDQAWNDHRATAAAPPDDEPTLMHLLASALMNVNLEIDPNPPIRAGAEGTYVDATLRSKNLAIALCDKNAAGGGLGKQVDALAQRASERGAVPIVLRSSEYPAPGASKVSQKLKGILQARGRKLVVTDADWRWMNAFQTFRQQYAGRPEFTAWVKSSRPLSGITPVKAILELDEATDAVAPSTGIVHRKESPRVPTARKVDPAPVPKPVASDSGFSVGQTRGLTPQPVWLSPRTLVTHAAFLGSTMSGKTTLALRIIEQLLIQGVPVLMVDRKGDLCTYATAEFWKFVPQDAESASIKRQLAERVEVCVFTPGEPKGRLLNLPVVPARLEELPAHERGLVARHAASALGAMMGYRKTSKTDETRLGILGKAIELVGRARSPEPLGIGELVSVLDTEDPDLVSSVGKLDPRHFHALVENLETLRLRYEHVLRAQGEALSPDLLFGLNGAGKLGKTKLSIISTKFLGDNAAIDFWMARLLGELGRWASRRPADSLQAVVFLDEADIYLPAQSKPATKDPMLDLLKRARSAGIGVFLATQSPGDLDYRCRDNIRTWFVGRVAEKTAVEKMKPLLSECRVNVAGRLALAKTGEFFKLENGEATELKATPSVMKTSQLAEEDILAAARSSAGS